MNNLAFKLLKKRVLFFKKHVQFLKGLVIFFNGMHNLFIQEHISFKNF